MQQIMEGFRLSPQQKRLWLLQQEHDVYRAYCSLHIDGPVSVARLRNALEAICSQHEIYRTSLRRLPQMKLPVQVVNASSGFVWKQADLRNCPPLDQQKVLANFVQEGLAAPFDLEEGPFVYCTLLTLHEEQHVLLVHLHALYADTTTLSRFAQELISLYEGTAAVSDTESVNYLQFSELQHTLLEEKEEIDDETHEHKTSREALATVSFPFERSHFEQAHFSPALLESSLSSELSAQIEAFFKDRQDSLPAFLLSCWQILLWRLTGRDDVLIGLAVDGRTYEELATIAGPLAKDMPFPGHLTESLSFGKLLAQTDETQAELLSQYPYFSWEDLISTTTNSSISPFYTFGFAFREQPVASKMYATSFSLQHCYVCSEPFKVKLTVVRSGSALTIEVQYDANVFEKRDMQRVISQFTTLLEHAMRQPDARIGELDMLNSLERKQVLVELNQTQVASPPKVCLHRLFERQVADTPDAVAVYDAEMHLTYDALDTWANRVARQIQEAGVLPEGLVGLCLPRSLELLIGVFGILKAGGAYVPLDSTLPKKRLAAIVEDARLSVVLTTSTLLATLPDIAQPICLDTAWGTLAQGSGEPASIDTVVPANLAYVLYTSGSTGRPKGVMISHQGLVQYVRWACQAYDVTAGRGTLLHSSLAFDLTVTSLFPPLVTGQPVWLSAEDAGIEALATMLRTKPDFSLVKLTPAHLELLNRSLAPEELAGTTRMLILGGEALSGESVAPWRLHAPAIRLINEYGPTETVVGSCTYEVPSQGVIRGSVPIGRPIANTQIYLLDQRMEPVPLGMIAEVYIGGVGVGRGYLHRADLSAERFVPHPFSTEAGARLYKTGDVARYISADGDLEYVGRIDYQVKIRGYRVELGEIEAVLRAHPMVQEVVVVVREEADAEKLLAAYLVVRPGAHLNREELRGWLGQQLPGYMVPARIVFLEALPLTPNGKVDRKALPAPDQNPLHDTALVGPRTPLEEVVALIWANLLHLLPTQVSMHDNFFALGGHSLLATRVIARLQALLQVALSVQMLFEAPTIAQLAQQIEQVLRQGEGIALPPPLLAKARPEAIPLSYAQQRLWFLDQLEPGSTAYLIPTALRIGGALSVSTLVYSVQALIKRHESLRTTFADWGADEAVQVIHPAGHVSLPVIDLQGLPPQLREEEAHRLASQEAQQPCDLMRGPLLRLALLRLQPDEQVLLLTFHHIITDGWSTDVFVRELTDLYRAAQAEVPSPLAPLSLQYADYALWQRQWLQGEVLEAQLSYWRQQLAGITPLALPTDHPRPAIQTHRGASQGWQIPETLTEALRILSQQQHVTMFMALLASFQVLLLHYSGQRDISVGTPIANRRQAEIEQTIGFFVNTLVLRSDLSGNPSFEEVLRQVREVCLGAYAHQDVPFEQVVEALEPERDLSRSPLFQVMFTLQNASQEEQAEGVGVQLHALNVENHTSQFDLTLSVEETRHGLHGSLEYNTDLFDAETIVRLLGHWQTLLEGVVQHPQVPLSEIPLLSINEMHQIHEHWNATRMSYPHEQCVHTLFEQQVQRTPDAIALLFEEEQLTYTELNARANQLASHLRGMGVGPDVLVGVCLERSLEMLIALLGVLKAGGAYVPLDPAYPQERLAFMIADAQVSVLIHAAHTGVLSVLPQNVQQVSIQEIRALGAQPHQEEIVAEVNAENLAYVIYTSGSTGRPKGTMVQHRNVLNLFTAIEETFTERPIGTWFAQTSMSFDISVVELIWTLTRGFRVVIGASQGYGSHLVEEPEHPVQVETMATQMQRQGVTHLQCTPSQASQLLDEPEMQEALGALDLFLLTGEALPFGLMQHVGDVAHGTLYNMYGPTETTIWSTMQRIEPKAPRVLIGHPLANTQTFILDEQGHLVPIGVPGELYIGGAGVARGYLRQPALTAERFVPDPWSQEPGARLYRTGDVARYRSDGSIECLGRVDQQVKIRGYRIEVGEIETALRSHPEVLDAVVLSREDQISGARHLIAYVVEAERLSAQILREFLRAKLPGYMIPAFFVPLDALPLNSNGKVDRRALPNPERGRENSETTFVAPRTQMETILTAIWSQVLGIEQVGIHDNFFALGGDSILSIQVVRRAKQAGLRITPRHMFQYQSIAQLAAIATDSVASQAEQSLVTGPVPLTPIQHWFFARNLPVPHHFHQGIVLQAQQTLHLSWVQQALWYVVLHHDALRLRFVQHGDDGWQAELAGAPVVDPFLCIDLTMLPQDQQEAVMDVLIEEAQTGIDLASGLLLRALFFVRGQASADRLLLLIHHLAVDAVSWRLLVEDLETAYRQLAQQAPLHLEDKTTSWKQWTQQLYQYAQTPAIQATYDYWFAAQRRAIPGLPEDLQGGSNTMASTETISVSLLAEQTQALLRDVPQAYHTQINEVLLTALTQAFMLWTGQSRLLLDLEGHGRQEIADDSVDLSRTVGWFTTIFPLLLDIEPGMEPGETLKAVKEQMRQIPHEGFSYGLLRYLHNDPAYSVDIADFPQAQVIFNYFGQLDATTYEHTLFHLAPASPGSLHSEQEPRSHLLEIDGQVVGGTLRVVWRYSRHIHRRETIQRLAQSFITCLQELIAHCQARDVSEHTPSDFPLVALNQVQLAALTRQVALSSQERVQAQIEDIYPLSPMQAGLLFHSLYEPASSVYCIYLSWTLRGPFNATAWQRSWQQVVDRHPILRTSFAWQRLDEPVQVVCTQVEVPWQIHDWRTLSLQQRHQQVEALRQREEHTGFDLQVAPLLRVALIRLEEDVYEIHLALHHLLLDGWSQALIMSEVQAYYQAFCQGKTLALASVRPYRDYIAWLRQQDVARAEQFWRQYLHGFTAPTQMVIDRQPYGSRSQANRVVEMEQRLLPEEITIALQDLGKQHRLTLNTIIQGVWALLLARYSGEEDVLFGATVAGRPADLAGVETMVGLFINTLPVRVRIEHAASLVSWLTGLQEQQVEVRHYEYTPLVDIQQWSGLAGQQALFDSLLLFQNYPFDPMSEEGESEITIQGSRSIEHTNYALTLTAAVAGQTFILRLAYDQSRFDAPTIARLMDQLHLVLASIVQNPHQRLADIPALTIAEQHTMVVEWNATQTDDASDCPIHTLVEQQALRTPDTIALICEESCITYGYMQAAARRVAASLQARHLPTGATIGLCVERSLEQVIGMLGILQAGGAYVPLDPSYPHERLAFMLEDSQAAALLTPPWWGEIFSALAIPQISLSDAVHTEDLPAAHVRETSAQQVAYLIYTSGSTGKPKGTMISHHAVSNFFASMSRRPGISAQEHILAVTSFSFDIAVLELLLPLTLGARVHIASQQVLADGTALAALVETSGATLVQATPSTWSMILAAGWTGSAPLKILCGGEALSGELAQELQQGGSTLWNMYGPTETTIWSTVEEVCTVEAQVSIGRPIENTQLYVLDSAGSLVPFGGVGELYIGGEGVAYGYWQRPDLSAERFLPDPFTQGAGGRMYRTGDRVRWLENGTLAYLGRVDQQIKLRGHRIELNEIAAVLREHAAVHDAVVVLREESEVHKYLAAYVVPQSGSKTTYQELRQHMQQRLPDYMMPTTIIELEALPLTPNGKVDRRALPVPELGQQDQGDAFVAPETELQEQLAAIWTEILGVTRISIHQNFFALGGNSLLATRLMVRLRSTFPVEVPLQALFETSTIAELAVVIERLQDELLAQVDDEELARLLEGLE